MSEKKDGILTAQPGVNRFKEALITRNAFCVTWEMVPGRGAFQAEQSQLLTEAARAAAGGKVHAIGVTDNPGGAPALSAEIFGLELKKLGIEPQVHVAMRDKNRNLCEGLLYGLSLGGIKNILVMTGDYPTGGFQGISKPVFDLDSVHGLQLVAEMNKGLSNEFAGKTTTLSPTDFFAGTTISPFKYSEPEVMGQYRKLHKKILAGAQFVVTQVGFDVRKFDEVLQWLKLSGRNLPAIASIFVLPYGAAKRMNVGEVPGCVVTDKLLAEVDKERTAPDKGKKARIERAAKLYAVVKGIGYAGVQIGGLNLTYDMVESVIDRGEELSGKWREFLPEFDYPCGNGFYLYEKDSTTGLNSDKPAPIGVKKSSPPVYLLSKLTHSLLFNANGPLFGLMQWRASFIDKRPALKRGFSGIEHFAKFILFGCQNCGDCALYDIAYLCPMSQCPRNQRNGPCGASNLGKCDVNTERDCIWVRAYRRLDKKGRAAYQSDYIVPPCNWALRDTSSWLNFYLGRDHVSKRLGVKAPKQNPNPKP